MKKGLLSVEDSIAGVELSFSKVADSVLVFLSICTSRF